MDKRPLTDSDVIEIDGEHLTIEQVAAVARSKARVHVSQEPHVKQRISASRSFLEEKLEHGEVIYGVNTGFGGNLRFLIPTKELQRHQENIFQFLICGCGPQLDEDVVRAAILLRANALLKGYSAVRLVVVERLLDLLNNDITPLVPRYGSVGASGDLIPSAYIARVLLGQGEVLYRGERMTAKEALLQARIEPIGFEPKEGIALINGTTTMTGMATMVAYDGTYLSLLVLSCCTLALEALRGTDHPFQETIQKLKNHPGQVKAAAICRKFLDGSRYVRNLDEIRNGLACKRNAASQEISRSDEPIQNPYSLRCAPQGIGPVLDAMEEHRATIEREINSVNDNPLVDPHDGHIYHTGNFYGGHIARALDSWKIDITTMGNWLHALMALLVDDKFSGGLPPNLAVEPGLFASFKGMQLCVTSLVSELRHSANPSMIHTLPTDQYYQDIVTLGTHAALTAMDMTTILRNTTAILLITLCQAIDLRGGSASLGKGDRAVYDAVRRCVAFVDKDRPLEGDIAKVADMIENRLIPV
jgi:phenylalanine ammonia-lyase